MTRRRRFASAARWLIEWLKSIAIAAVVWLVLRTFVLEGMTIVSGSMTHTLLVGDFLFVNKFLYGAEVPLIHQRLPEVREPRHGDVIVFNSVEPTEVGMKIVKRVIGTPGDTLQMEDGVMYRDGMVMREPYAVNSNPTGDADMIWRPRMRAWQVAHFAGRVPVHYTPDLHDWGPVVVPHDSLFVLGDNRDNSLDSRYWGFLPRANVYAKAWLIYFSYDAESYHRLPFATQVRWHRILTRVR